jgi:hypothetical protein
MIFIWLTYTAGCHFVLSLLMTGYYLFEIPILIRYNEMGKFEAYVIFGGPMKGIYRKWAIAKQHIIDKNVRHKGYKTMKEAEQALYGSYKEVTTTKNLQRSPTMKSKKKMSIDKIRQLEHQKNFQITNLTYMEFSLRWKWINNYVEEFTTQCFYPFSRFGCTKAVILPGVDSTTCLSFFQNDLIHTIYIEKQPGKTFGELKFLPKELQNLAHSTICLPKKKRSFLRSTPHILGMMKLPRILSQNHCI